MGCILDVNGVVTPNLVAFEAVARQRSDVHWNSALNISVSHTLFSEPVNDRDALHIGSSIYISPKIKAQQRPSIRARPPSHANHVFIITQTVKRQKKNSRTIWGIKAAAEQMRHPRPSQPKLRSPTVSLSPSSLGICVFEKSVCEEHYRHSVGSTPSSIFAGTPEAPSMLAAWPSGAFPALGLSFGSALALVVLCRGDCPVLSRSPFMTD